MIAFKPQSLNPSKPSGMPDEWPWMQINIDESQVSQFQLDGWTVMSAEDYVLYKASYQSAFDAWYATQPIQFESDKQRYIQRANSKDSMIATLAAGNMSRIRAGTWTVPELVSFMQDAVVIQILTDINTLSFELAFQKVDLISSPLVTDQIKADWKALLAANFYL